MKARFQLVEVFNRGYNVAHIRDTKGGRDFFIRRDGRFYLQWDRSDTPIPPIGPLRVAARRALNAAEAGRVA